MKSYKEQRKSAEEIGTQAETGMDGSSAEELTAKIAAAYNGKSNGDMMRGILAEAEPIWFIRSLTIKHIL